MTCQSLHCFCRIRTRGRFFSKFRPPSLQKNLTILMGKRAHPFNLLESRALILKKNDNKLIKLKSHSEWKQDQLWAVVRMRITDFVGCPSVLGIDYLHIWTYLVLLSFALLLFTLLHFYLVSSKSVGAIFTIAFAHFVSLCPIW